MVHCRVISFRSNPGKIWLDKRVGMLVVNLAGTKTRSIVIGILLGTAIPTAFVGEHAVAANVRTDCISIIYLNE